MRINGVTAEDESVVDDELHMAAANAHESHAYSGSPMTTARMDDRYPPLAAGTTYLARFHRQVRETTLDGAGCSRLVFTILVLTGEGMLCMVRAGRCWLTLSCPVTTTQTTHVDELSFRTGDRMQVMEEGSNGPWVLVHGVDCNETGLVPYEALAEVSRGAFSAGHSVHLAYLVLTS